MVILFFRVYLSAKFSFRKFINCQEGLLPLGSRPGASFLKKYFCHDLYWDTPSHHPKFSLSVWFFIADKQPFSIIYEIEYCNYLLVNSVYTFRDYCNYLFVNPYQPS